MAELKAKTDNSSNESLFTDEKHKVNRNNPAFSRKGSKTRLSHADNSWLMPLKGNSQPSEQKTDL